MHYFNHEKNVFLQTGCALLACIETNHNAVIQTKDCQIYKHSYFLPVLTRHYHIYYVYRKVLMLTNYRRSMI